MGAERQAAGPQRVSIWAVLSLLCGIVVLCPAATLLAPVLGVVALVDIRRKPHRRGTRLALAGILLGLVATVGWGGGLRWWHVNARVPMLRGPAEALGAGQSGDVAGFMASFAPQTPATIEAEAMAFLDEVGGRYGHLLGSEQRPLETPEASAAPMVDTRRPRLAHTFFFDAGPVETDAEFVVWAEGQGLVLKFGWLAFRDADQGDLVYPASAAGLVGYDPVSPPEPSP